MENKKTPTEIDRVIGALIKTARKERGMSQELLAEKIGLTFQQVQKYENGSSRVSVGRLFDIAKATGKSISYFVDNTLLKGFENYSLSEFSTDAVKTDPQLYFRIINGLTQIKDEQILLAIVDIIERFSITDTLSTRH